MTQAPVWTQRIHYPLLLSLSNGGQEAEKSSLQNLNIFTETIPLEFWALLLEIISK